MKNEGGFNPHAVSRKVVVPALLFFGLAGGLAYGQGNRPAVLDKVGIDQKLNAQLPLEITFRDESGGDVRLRDYFGKKPVILSFAYYTCPMLCPMEMEGIVKALRVLPFDLGKEFVAVNISINPDETPQIAAEKKAGYVKEYNRPGAAAAWHFLTGKEPSIRKAADAVGFRYTFDEETKQFAHASGIMILTPEGKVSRYFYGIEYSARDLRLGLVEADQEKIGTPVDQVLLYCFHYDPVTGKYGLVIMNVIRLLGTATVLILGSFMFLMFRRDRKGKRPEGAWLEPDRSGIDATNRQGNKYQEGQGFESWP